MRVRSKHTANIDYSNVTINENVIKTKTTKATNRKSKIGSKFNKYDLDILLPKKDRMKIYRKAKKDRRFSLHAFCDLYRPYTFASYEFVNKALKPKEGEVVNELAALLINLGIIEIKINKEKVEQGLVTRPKYYVKWGKQKDLCRIIKNHLVNDYQRQKFLSRFGNSL